MRRLVNEENLWSGGRPIKWINRLRFQPILQLKYDYSNLMTPQKRYDCTKYNDKRIFYVHEQKEVQGGWCVPRKVGSDLFLATLSATCLSLHSTTNKLPARKVAEVDARSSSRKTALLMLFLAHVTTADVCPGSLWQPTNRKTPWSQSGGAALLCTDGCGAIVLLPIYPALTQQ